MSLRPKEGKSLDPSPKSKGGRPTTYKPEYCEQIVEFCKKGGFLAEFAVEIGVHTDTLHEWKKVHKEFSEYYKRAKEANKVFLMKLCREGGRGKVYGFQGSPIMFLLKAVHGLNEFGPQEQDDTELLFSE